MSAYILRNIDPALWDRVKLRAGRDGLPLRQVILLLLRAYAEERVFLSAGEKIA